MYDYHTLYMLAHGGHLSEDDLYEVYGMEIPAASREQYEILECDRPEDLPVVNAANPKPYKIYKSIKHGYWFEHISDGSVEESLDHCYNKMQSDAFYMGANAVLHYDTIMSFWEGVVTYRVSGNVVTIAEKKELHSGLEK